MIPKIIHQVWVGDKPIPDHQLEWIEKWKELYPDFEYKLWVSNEFGENKFSKTVLDLKEYAYYSDWIRTNVLYKYGGIYIDTDVLPIKKIPIEYFSKNLVLPKVSEFKLSNYFMMSSKGNRFMKNLIELYKNYNDNEFIWKKWVAPETLELSIIKTFGKYSVKNSKDDSFKQENNNYKLLEPLETAPYHPFKEVLRIPDEIPTESFCIHYWNAYKTANNLDKTDFSSI